MGDIICEMSENTGMILSSDIEALAQMGVATVHEALGQSGLLDHRLRPIFRPACIAGPAFTCEVPPGDNLTIHAALEACLGGEVLVVAPTEPCESGYFGDLLGTSAKARGVAGLIIDAGVRDIAALTALGFPAWSRAVNAQGTSKQRMGRLNVPIVCGGQVVAPGDIIVADDDGVVVVPQDQVAAVLERARTRDAAEAAIRARLEAGELTLDVLNLRGYLT